MPSYHPHSQREGRVDDMRTIPDYLFILTSACQVDRYNIISNVLHYQFSCVMWKIKENERRGEVMVSQCTLEMKRRECSCAIVSESIVKQRF